MGAISGSEIQGFFLQWEAEQFRIRRVNEDEKKGAQQASLGELSYTILLSVELINKRFLRQLIDPQGPQWHLKPRLKDWNLFNFRFHSQFKLFMSVLQSAAVTIVNPVGGWEFFRRHVFIFSLHH